MKKKESRRGMVLIMSLVFIAVFTSLSFAMLTMSSRNLKIADNHRDGSRALESAMSGVEVMKYWMSKVNMPGTTPTDQWFSTMSANLASYVPIAQDVSLCSAEAKSFYTRLIDDPVEPKKFAMTVTGTAGNLQRTVVMNYSFGLRKDTVFDFGVATKGPLHLSGNIAVDGTNIAVEADVYIESESSNDALSIIGNSQIAGDVKITNPDAEVTLQGGQAGIGTDEFGNPVTGQDALDNHVETGVPPTDFPYPNTDHFEQYVTGDTINADTDFAANATYENVRIAAGTNPHFSGDVTINGIMFIEAPNVVCFSGNCNINGLIVADGDVTDNSGANQLIFLGNIGSTSVTDLPEESQFDGLREETGTFVMAPGFKASFGGSFETLNGAIAANGIDFFGNAGGTIGGSVLNYSPAPMTLSGNSDLLFNRSGTDEVPAGFEPEIVINYDPATYNEIVINFDSATYN